MFVSGIGSTEGAGLQSVQKTSWSRKVACRPRTARASSCIGTIHSRPQCFDHACDSKSAAPRGRFSGPAGRRNKFAKHWASESQENFWNRGQEPLISLNSCCLERPRPGQGDIPNVRPTGVLRRRGAAATFACKYASRRGPH